MENPFLTTGYKNAEYFCDRKKETDKLTRLLINGNNVAMVSPRRMGKTGLIHHCFAQSRLTRKYNTFIVDIYATKNLNDLVYELGRQIVTELKSRGRRRIDKFFDIVKSLRSGISFDLQGLPTWNVELGDVRTPSLTLDEIFSYMENAEKPCLVAIDEFQSISYYPEKNIEATLRTYIQRCNNTHFIFAGSQRSKMNEMFCSPARPFYQSVTIMNLESIPEDKYATFAKYHFEKNDRVITDEAFHDVYERFNGVTWYIQKVMNQAFSMTEKGETCGRKEINRIVGDIVEENAEIYKNNLFQISSPQKALLVAIGKEGTASQITGRNFIKKYSLASASSVQKAAAALLEKQIITYQDGQFEVYDKFFATWLKANG